jgi:hypothetical protein
MEYTFILHKFDIVHVDIFCYIWLTLANNYTQYILGRSAIQWLDQYMQLYPWLCSNVLGNFTISQYESFSLFSCVHFSYVETGCNGLKLLSNKAPFI